MTERGPVDRHDLEATLPWMASGTTHLRGVVDALADAALAQPSALPGWSRAHVVGHVARNAEALVRLATWARTGVETPMYAGPQQRAEEIEQAAVLPASDLRSQLATTADTLRCALDGLDGKHWNATVRSAQGRYIPATEIPWMRIREVWLHAIDLDAGATLDDLPAGVVDLLLDDVSAALSARNGCPPVRLVPSDRDRAWSLGADPRSGTEIRAPARHLAGWLTGRTPATELHPAAPELPRWL